MPETDDATSRKFVKWSTGLVAGAVLAGLGGYIWTNTEGWLENRTDPVVTDASPEIDLLANPSDWSKGQPNWDPFFYYLPGTTANLTKPPRDCRERREWAWNQGGSDADQSRLRLTVTGEREGEVSLDSMSVAVTSQPLEKGIVAACPVGGASSSVHGLVVDLGEESVRFVEADEEVPARFTLAKGETEAFDIYAVGYEAARLYEWRVKLSVVAEGDRRTIVIDDDGQPFRTAGAAAARTPMVIWKDGAWRGYDP